MADSTRPNPSDDSTADGAGTPSLDDLDSLLSAAADLAKELSTDLGAQEDSASGFPNADAAPIDAQSVDAADAVPAVHGEEEPGSATDEEPADAVAQLDAQLTGVQELATRAAADIGTVEQVSGDPQILAALSPATDAPSEPPALTPGDRAFLNDLDDLTSTGDAGNLDAFGAPPPRGASAMKPPDPSVRMPALDPPAPFAEKPTSPAPRPSESVRRPSVAGLEDLMAPAPESADSEAAPSKGRSAPAAAHVDLPTRPKAFGIAAPPPSAQPVAPTAAQPEPLSPLASGLAGIMKVMDAPFAWMPLPIKRACGWLAVAMLVAAAALQGRALLHRSEDLAENGITKPSTHVGESASVEERTTEQASEDDATQDSQVQSAHE